MVLCDQVRRVGGFSPILAIEILEGLVAEAVVQMYQGFSPNLYEVSYLRSLTFHSQELFQWLEEKRGGAMLEGLDAVSWEKLSHAYGKAGDVPGQLRDLLSSDEKIGRAALSKLCGNIFHQGSRWEASGHAIPFLFEILMEPTVHHRADILNLILGLALGYPEELLPEGVDPQTTFGDGKSRYSRWYRKSYRAFADRWQSVQQLTRDPDLQVRLWAVYGLAWIPKQAQSSLAMVRGLFAEESNTLFRANMIVTLGLLNRYREEAADSDLASEGLSPNVPPVLRLSSAIALVSMRPQEMETAYDVILSSLKLPAETFTTVDDSGNKLKLPLGDLVDYAAKTLVWMPAGNEARIVEVIGEALPYADGVRGLVMTRLLLRLVFEVRSRTPRILQELTPLQSQVVRAIGSSGGWKIGGKPFGNYGLLLSEYGLPADSGRYQKFLRSDS